MRSRPTVVIDLVSDLGLARDLSAGGIFVPGCELEINSDCELVVRGADEELSLPARVVFVDAAKGAGLELIGFGPTMRERLAGFVAAANGEAARGSRTDLESQRIEPMLAASALGSAGHDVHADLELQISNDIAYELDGLTLEPLQTFEIEPPGPRIVRASTPPPAPSFDESFGVNLELDDALAEWNELASDRDLAIAAQPSAYSEEHAREHVGESGGFALELAELDDGSPYMNQYGAVLLDEPGTSFAVGTEVDDSDVAAIARPAYDDGGDESADDHAPVADPGDLGNGSGAATEADSDNDDDERKRLGLNHNERLRGLSLIAQVRKANSVDPSERMALERMYGKNVWEALLRNQRLTAPEVARIARMGALPRTLIELILGNGAWLHVPEVRRALLQNPKLSTDQITRILRIVPKHELKLASTQTVYPYAVRDTAKRLLRELGD